MAALVAVAVVAAAATTAEANPATVRTLRAMGFSLGVPSFFGAGDEEEDAPEPVLSMVEETGTGGRLFDVITQRFFSDERCGSDVQLLSLSWAADVCLRVVNASTIDDDTLDEGVTLSRVRFSCNEANNVVTISEFAANDNLCVGDAIMSRNQSAVATGGTPSLVDDTCVQITNLSVTVRTFIDSVTVPAPDADTNATNGTDPSLFSEAFICSPAPGLAAAGLAVHALLAALALLAASAL